jgi:hypothetical protein
MGYGLLGTRKDESRGQAGNFKDTLDPISRFALTFGRIYRRQKWRMLEYPLICEKASSS